jgi:hypothetical protein
MALTDKTVASTYKDLLTLNNSNSGATSAGTTIQDGNGTNTALTLGTRNSTFRPATDHTAILSVENAAGDDILRVDTSNKLVKVNETQSIANTQYLRFGYNDIDVDSGTHIGVPIMGAITNANVTFGTSTDPSAPNVSNNGDDWIHYLHYVDTNITVDAVNVLVGATAATGDSLNFHLLNLATGDTTTIDEWSSTTVVADDSGTSNAGYEQFYRVVLNIQSANVDAGNYLALTVEGDGTNSDYSINALIRYHLR